MIALRAVLVRVQSKVVSDNVLQEAIKVAEKHQENNESMIVVQAASALLGELALKMNQVANIVVLGMCFITFSLCSFDYLFRKVPRCMK